jgi:hypothetical protein
VGHAVVATGRRALRLPSFKFSLADKGKVRLYLQALQQGGIELHPSYLSGLIRRFRLGTHEVGHAAIATGRRELRLRSSYCPDFSIQP